ncbi:hypothetical protein DFJ73DRAFT_92098 [Zopfochytrium polystomum]|nr:hypothetical protein DFJ73DRAFT_92098 [Zopfochytrium polystomum]
MTRPTERTTFSPKVFNDGTVSLDWDGRDAYNPLVTLKRDKTSEIDHVIEKQIGSAVVGDVLRAGMVDKCHRSYLVELVGELVVNRKDNLRYTQKQTNLLKGAAVSNILNDYYSDGNVHPSGLTGYIRLQAKLGREETALINEVMEKAWKSCLRRLEGEGDSPELGAVELKLRYLRDVMKFA